MNNVENECEKIMIYPYGVETVEFVRTVIKKSSKFKITSLVSYSGSGYIGDDGSIVDYREEIGISVGDDYENGLKYCDSVLIAECAYSKKNRKIIIDNIKLALNKKRNVYCNIYLDDNEKKVFLNISEQMNVTFNSLYIERKREKEDIIGVELIEPNIPIIFVSELFPYIGAANIIHKLSSFFEQKGYKVANLGMMQFTELLGGFDYPNFMKRPIYSCDEMVIELNIYIQEIIEKSKANILIIRLPDSSIQSRNSINQNGFGIMSYIVSKAVRPDCFIMSLTFNLCYDSVLVRIREAIEKQFNCGLTCVEFTNYYSLKTDTDYLFPTSVSKAYDRIEKYINSAECNIPIFSAFGSNKNSKMCQYIMENLLEESYE